MFKKLVSLITLIMVMSVLFAGCGNSKKTDGAESKDNKKSVKLKMSVTTSEGSTWSKGAKKFAELVSEKTNGGVTVKVYSNEQLSGGNQAKGVEMLRNGAIDLSFHSNIIYSIMDEKFGVISLPWLLPDYKTVDEKLSGAGGEAINKLLLEKGVVGLGFGENGYRQVTNSKKDIKNPEDIKGMKIRIPGIKMYISLFKALGADPTAMNFAEVFTSLQQKAIDGQENPTDVISSSKLYEVQEYMTLWNYSYDSIILGMNKTKFDSLDAETQKAIKEAAQEACKYQRELNRKLGDEQVEFFKEKGMKVTTLTENEINEFKNMVKSVYDEYEPIMGKELIDSFK